MSHGPIKRELIQAELESTYATDPTPAAGDSVLVRNINFNPDRLRMVRRGAIRTSLGELQQIYGGSLRAIAFECEVKGSGSAGTAPEIGPLLRACGLQETIVASTSVTYAPRSSGLESCTIYYHESAQNGASGVRHILLGCRGNLELIYTAGDILLARFSLIGKVSANPTDQTIPTPTYDTTVPVAIRGMSTTVGAVGGLVIQGYTLTLNNEMVIPDNVNDSEGYGEVTINGRDVQLELVRHNELVATLAPWADMTAGTARAFVASTLGATAGNRIALNAPQMHYRGIGQADQDGLRGATYQFGCHESATGNDEFSLVFT